MTLWDKEAHRARVKEDIESCPKEKERMGITH